MEYYKNLHILLNCVISHNLE